MDTKTNPTLTHNFIRLCEGGFVNELQERVGYEGTGVNRVVHNQFITFGQMSGVRGSRNTHGTPHMPVECFSIEHNAEGVVGMIENNEVKNTVTEEFYITLRALPHFNNRFQSIGRVVKGMGVLREINTNE